MKRAGAHRPPVVSEVVREAAWAMVDALDYQAFTWGRLLFELDEWSEPTLRRASRLLQDAGVISFDRKTGLWSRVDGAPVPFDARPRAALLAALELAEVQP